jgi:high-affinity nickel-transport protein
MPQRSTHRRSLDSPTINRKTPLRIDPSVVRIVVAIAALHIIGWGTLVGVVVPLHLSIGTKAFGLGVGITAYMLGVRHAFDADHIAAIDNTTRKLLGEGRPSGSVGFWFSFGHSSVVFGLTVLLALGIRSFADHLANSESAVSATAGLIGTLVSSGFLCLMAVLNIVALLDIWRAFRRLRAGQYNEAALERQIDNRGLVIRLLRPLMKAVTQPWQMVAVGFLFGLGFDTATEIALLVLSSSGAASGLPWYAILCLPMLFAAGMLLFDTIDGSFMKFAYGWALSQPVRKIYYNLVVTGLSVAVALLIGGIETLGLLGERHHLRGAFWTWVSGIDLNSAGFVIVGLFVASWSVSLIVWKYANIEARYAIAPGRSSERDL